MNYGKPDLSGQNRVKEVPDHIVDWVSKENERNEVYARHRVIRKYLLNDRQADSGHCP